MTMAVFIWCFISDTFLIAISNIHRVSTGFIFHYVLRMGVSCTYITNFLCFISCVLSLWSYFLVLQQKHLKALMAFLEGCNLSPWQWDYYGYAHFTGWEAEKRDVAKCFVWKKDACVYAKLSFTINVFPLTYIYTPNSLLRPEGVCMFVGGILS